MSDNELDAELLALAGDDSGSGQEDNVEQPKAQKSSSPLGSPEQDSTKTRPAREMRSAPATKKTISRPGRGPARRRKEESEDDGRTSPEAKSPQSLGSGAMSESDGDATANDADTTNDASSYPLEGKFKDTVDKANIMAMSEIQREEILAERAQEIERKAQDLQLRRLLQQREKSSAKVAEKKRKAGTADLEESPRKTTRAKAKASADLENYKRQREQRNEQRRRDDERRVRDGPRSPSRDRELSDADHGEADEVEWDDRPTRSEVRRQEPKAELRDFQRVTVGRSNFAKVCFTPGFDEAIKGCFCRVNIGPDRASGQNQYRMTQIKGFTIGRPYAMEGPNGKPLQIDQYAIIAQGKAEKEWPFLACSDSRITDAEFDRYQRTLAADNLKPPTLAHLTAKLDGIHALINHNWTEAEISAKIRRSGVHKAKYAAFDRTRLASERADAVARDDEAAIARIDVDLAALDGPKLAYGSGAPPSRPEAAAPPRAPSQQERLAQLNRQNRLANQDAIRKAQLAEKRAEQREQAKVARGEATANRFARVKTRAKVRHDIVGEAKSVDAELFGEGVGNDESRAATPVSAPTKSAVASNGAEKKTGLERTRMRSGRHVDDDIIAEMDLGIEIDI